MGRGGKAETGHEGWSRPWGEVLAREHPDSSPYTLTADSGHSHLKTPRYRDFQQLHCAAKKTEAQGRNGGYLSSLCCHLSSMHSPSATALWLQPSQCKTSWVTLGLPSALSGPLSLPFPIEWQGRQYSELGPLV